MEVLSLLPPFFLLPSISPLDPLDAMIKFGELSQRASQRKMVISFLQNIQRIFGLLTWAGFLQFAELEQSHY
jgi:hypothetical protein